MTKNAHTISAMAVPTVMSCVNMLTIGPVSTVAESSVSTGIRRHHSAIGVDSEGTPVPQPSLGCPLAVPWGCGIRAIDCMSAQLLEVAIMGSPVRTPSQERRRLTEPSPIVDQPDSHLAYDFDGHRRHGGTA